MIYFYFLTFHNVYLTSYLDIRLIFTNKVKFIVVHNNFLSLELKPSIFGTIILCGLKLPTQFKRQTHVSLAMLEINFFFLFVFLDFSGSDFYPKLIPLLSPKIPNSNYLLKSLIDKFYFSPLKSVIPIQIAPA